MTFLLPRAVTTSALTLLVGCAPILRAAETKTSAGIIINKIVRPASTYQQYPAGKRGGFSGPAEIPIAESVVFEIKVERLGTVRYSTNTIAAKEFDVGQRVQIEYVKRAIIPLRTRIYVKEMRRAE
jgi:hypothetical protein